MKSCQPSHSSSGRGLSSICCVHDWRRIAHKDAYMCKSEAHTGSASELSEQLSEQMHVGTPNPSATQLEPYWQFMCRQASVVGVRTEGGEEAVDGMNPPLPLLSPSIPISYKIHHIFKYILLVVIT